MTAKTQKVGRYTWTATGIDMSVDMFSQKTFECHQKVFPKQWAELATGARVEYQDYRLGQGCTTAVWYLQIRINDVSYIRKYFTLFRNPLTNPLKWASKQLSDIEMIAEAKRIEDKSRAV